MEFNNVLEDIDTMMTNRNFNRKLKFTPFMSREVQDNLGVLHSELRRLKDKRENLMFLQSPFHDFSNELKNLKPYRKNFKLTFEDADTSLCVHYSPLAVRLFSYDESEIDP